MPRRPLDGVRVLELASLVAAPFCGQLLASFGADVIKVEPPEGDALRGWRTLDDTGTSYWWRSLARNKRLVAVDLRVADGQALARRLAARADVLVESFRPGTLEGWGLGPDALWKENAALVVARVSGFGQTGPSARKPGFAAVAEAWGGLRHLTGMPGEPPVRANLSLGDTLAGLHAALGVLLALRARETSGRGQVVDVSLVESVLAVLESVIPEAAGAGVVRAPSGTGLTGVVPSDLYPCADGFVVIGANADPVFARLMRLIGHEDLAADRALAQNPGRVAARDVIDAAIGAWTRARSVEEVVRALDAAEVPVGPLRDAAGLLRDPQLVARGAFEDARAEGRRFVLPAAMPRLTETPARTTWAGAALGAHTDEVLREAGLGDDELAALRRERVIA